MWEAWRVSDALQSLTGWLGFNESSYTVYIMNPKRPSLTDLGSKYVPDVETRPGTYGYRQGYSTSTMNDLQALPPHHTGGTAAGLPRVGGSNSPSC